MIFMNEIQGYWDWADHLTKFISLWFRCFKRISMKNSWNSIWYILNSEQLNLGQKKKTFLTLCHIRNLKITYICCDHFTIFINVKSLCYPPETNVICPLYSELKKKKTNKDWGEGLIFFPFFVNIFILLPLPFTV